MNKVLKWILYVVLGLVILAVVAGIVFMAFGGYGFRMMGRGYGMMEPFGRYYFNPIRGIFGGLIGLGIFVLVIVGIVALVSALVRGNRSAQTPPTAQPTQSVTPSRTCSNCGKPAQDDWKTCPYCGNPLT